MYFQAERKETVAAIARGTEMGWLVPRVADEFTLKEAGDAHKLLKGGQGAKGRIILSTV